MTRSRDAGVAAVELALTLTLVLAFTAFLLPLPIALLEKGRLEQAADRTARWATSVPGSVRPRLSAVETEAREALLTAGGTPAPPDSAVPGSGFSATVSAPISGQGQCPRRRLRTVTLTNDVQLGPLSTLLDAVRTGPSTPGRLSITATATACEE